MSPPLNGGLKQMEEPELVFLLRRRVPFLWVGLEGN